MIRILLALGLLYALGFGFFVALVPAAADPASEMPHADAVVALTGGGERLGPAVALLEKGAGGRLLITGVNPATTKKQLRNLLKGSARYDCCADLGFEATDTKGNAREAASWARTHQFRSLIVVTTDLHMPRSLLEFEAEMPDVSLIPYAVSSAQPDTLWSERLPSLNGEFVKYIASTVRLAIAGHGAAAS